MALALSQSKSSKNVSVSRVHKSVGLHRRARGILTLESDEYQSEIRVGLTHTLKECGSAHSILCNLLWHMDLSIGEHPHQESN